MCAPFNQNYQRMLPSIYLGSGIYTVNMALRVCNVSNIVVKYLAYNMHMICMLSISKLFNCFFKVLRIHIVNIKCVEYVYLLYLYCI